MKQHRTITRREFLRMSALATAGIVSAACGTPATPVPTQAPAATTAPAAPPTVAPTKPPAPTAAPVSKYKEAPMLAELVKAGKLPAVDQRLPKNPMVMTGYEGIGKHGGTWRRCFNGVSDRWGPTKLVDRGWAWFDKNLNLIPRILESWQASPDGKVWTIKLREGTRWSDGVEHTTADYAWWYKNELGNKKVTPGTQTIWADPDKTMVKFEAVDKYTAKFTYGKPKPMFIYNMVRGGQGGTTSAGPITPSHYMAKVHEDTTTDKAALEADWKKLGFASWEKYYVDRAQWWYLNIARPHLGGWVAKNEMTAKEIFVMERNPYFFAVDSQGNQLPYVDKVTHRLFENAEMKNLWVTNGEIDMQYRHMTIGDLALYKSAEAKGDYKVVLGIGAGHVAMQLNLTTKNKPLNEFFNVRNVRIAISHAINRDEINQLIYNGMYKPRQYSPLPMSPQYYEKLSNAYLKYDPDTANKLLDEAGYSKKGADGIRLFKDGTTPISFIVEHTDTAGTPAEDAWMLVSKQLAKVGIKATPKYMERALYTQHYTANDIEAAFWGGDRTVLPLVPEAQLFRGLNADRPWAVAWGWWYTTPDHPAAQKPPDGHWIWDIWKIWDEEVSVEVDPVKQTAAFKKLLDIWATELPYIGILGEQPTPTIVKNGFKGYPAGMPNDDPTGDEQFCQSETYYWDDPAKHIT
jgi:peptide/nickel transport system substrate-binding protein